MSSSTYSTFTTTIPLYNSLINHIEDTENEDNIDPIIKEAAILCKKKLLEYYNKTNESYLIATILDPILKLQHYKNNDWEKEIINDINKM